MVYIEILAVVLLTLMNGVLAMSELALVSPRKSLLKQLASEGSRGAAAAVRLYRRPGQGRPVADGVPGPGNRK